MADRIDQLTIGASSYDIALPADSKDTMFYTTASATANAFTVTIPDVQALYDGLAVNVKFNAATATNCTLNVNNLGAKSIYYRTGTACTTHIAANMYVTLIYNGTGWVMQGTWPNADTKNTAGSSNSTADLYIIGAGSQNANGVQTYSNSSVLMNSGTIKANGLTGNTTLELQSTNGNVNVAPNGNSNINLFASNYSGSGKAYYKGSEVATVTNIANAAIEIVDLTGLE